MFATPTSASAIATVRVAFVRHSGHISQGESTMASYMSTGAAAAAAAASDFGALIGFYCLF